MTQITAGLINELPKEQDLEFRTEFGNTNYLLRSTVANAPEAELLAAGERLISSDSASQKILRIRLVRELKQLAERATSDMAGLLHRERDDDVSTG